MIKLKKIPLLFKLLLRSEPLLFLLVLGFEITISCFLIMTHRIDCGHDGFQYFFLQYYFLNNIVNVGEIPQWMPFMTHGTVASWLYAITSGLLQSTLFLTGSLLKNVNFIPIYQMGMFIDELVLIVGVWFLARRFYSSVVTIFFVALTVLGSCIWMLQPWSNFHFYYALPLILYFGHVFLDNGKWRYVFLAGTLFIVQFMGNLPYLLPIISLVVFLYFFLYILFNFKQEFETIKLLKINLSCLLCICALALLFFAVYKIQENGVDQIVNYNYGRELNGRTTLEGFMSYGGNQDASKWKELFVGVSPAFDYTLYIGILATFFILLGFKSLFKRKHIHFLVLIFMLFLFSLGTFVSTFFYYTWPLMQFYRHLSLVAPIIKLFICFLAGFGFEALFIENQHVPQKNRPKALILAALFLFLFSTVFYCFGRDPVLAKSLIRSTITKGVFAIDGSKKIIKYHAGLPVFPLVFYDGFAALQFTKSALLALILSVLVVFLPVIRERRYYKAMVAFILFFHIADLYGYKISQVNLRTVSIKSADFQLTNFQSMPYAKKRSLNYLSADSRIKILPYILPSRGQLYSTMNSFLFLDEIGNTFRADYWLSPLDDFMRAYWGQSIHDKSVRPEGWVPYIRLSFPLTHQASGKIAGLAEDKVQFFSGAYLLDSDDGVAVKITDGDYKGDILFLSPPQTKEAAGISNIKNWLPNGSLSDNERLKIHYQVTRFDSNHLEVVANLTGHKKAWMLYSDVWHPFWKATVNGKPVPVYKANLAYKAVPLALDQNRIHFYFNSPLMAFLQKLFSLIALFWLGVIGYLIWKILFGPSPLSKPLQPPIKI